MEYWLLTTEYPPLSGGGIGTYCYYTARMLQKEGHNVTVFIYDLSLSEDSVSIIDEIRVVRFVPRRTGTHKFLGFNAYISYEYASIIKSFVEREGVPEIIESQEYHGIAYYLLQFKWLGYQYFKSLNVLITCHAPSFICLDYNHVPVYKFPDYWTGQMEKASIRSADILIAPSKYFVEQAKNRMLWQNIKEHNVVNPIEVDQEGNIPLYEQNRLICFGKLSPLKGTFELIEYFQRLWSQGFHYALEIVGGIDQIFHPEGATMGDIIKLKYGKYIADKFLILHNQVSQEDAKQLMFKAHVVIVPSLFDNLPYTVLEAMSWGKVVLASTQGGQAEVIKHGENGFLFDHAIGNDFEAKLLQILNLDDKTILRIGAKAKETILKSFTPAIIYQHKIRIIEKHLSEKKNSKCYPLISSSNESKTNKTIIDNTLLSIVVPYYNMGVYIEECIQSILKADYKEKEIIIVDDGSTEEFSINKLLELESKYSVNIIRNKNEGLPKARNCGANAAKGRYLAFLDADDTISSDYFSKAIEVLTNYDNIHFVGCWAKYFGEGKGVWPAFNPEPPYLLVHNMVNSSALVYERDSFVKAGLNNPRMVYGMEDWDSVINMVKNNFFGVVLPEAKFNYRVRQNSMARKFTRVKRLYLNKLIAERHSDYYKLYGDEIMQLLNTNGSALDFDNPTYETNSSDFMPISGALKERIKEKIKQNKIVRKIAYKIYKKIIR